MSCRLQRCWISLAICADIYGQCSAVLEAMTRIGRRYSPALQVLDDRLKVRNLHVGFAPSASSTPKSSVTR
ncbi:hypothetical protein FXB40_01940 [Bradyrhizobium rifense]|uniref:Uncharacterized protein n=1 Tax=Bradyrhizobium rifense TaxID=515499 RepID=A0A5D3KRW3_9BRAD|nr:hypothetical protein FXB40_01940 [Bradyrhizobium rifense]